MKFTRKIAIMLLFLNYSLHGSECNSTFSSFYKQNSSCFKTVGVSALGLLCCGAYYLTENNAGQSELFQGSLFASTVGLAVSGGHLIHSYINRNKKLFNFSTLYEDVKEDDYSMNEYKDNYSAITPEEIYGITGFKNDGNRCYMNSALQLLRIIFPTEVNSLTHNDTDNLYQDVAQRIQKTERGDLYSQRDAHQCLSILLERIEELEGTEVLEIKESDEINQRLNNIAAMQSKKFKIDMRTLEDPTHCIDASILKEMSSTQYLNLNSLDEVLKHYIDQYDCATDSAPKLLPFGQVGKFFMIKLNRFIQFNSANQKLTHKVDIPFKLDITPYLANKFDTRIYELKGVVVHIGSSIYHGHYKTYIKVDDAWVCCNDASVTAVDQADVIEQINHNAYIILYQEKSSKSASQLVNCVAPIKDTPTRPKYCYEDHYNSKKTHTTNNNTSKQCIPKDFYFLSIKNDKLVIEKLLTGSITADTNNDEPTQEIDYIPCSSILKFYGSKEKLRSTPGFEDFRQQCSKNGTSIVLYPNIILI